MRTPHDDFSLFGSPDDTIAAIASPPGNGAISVIRVSGALAFDCLKKIFHPASPKTSMPPEHAKMTLGSMLDPDSGAKLDQSMAVFFKSPDSYTGENLVEVFCHGGRLVTKEVLSSILKSGARLAHPGEFTQRALLNGKMDLSQAEAVLDVINARNRRFLEASLKKLSGSLGNQLKEIRSSLINLLASIEVAIDYPEDNTPQVSTETIKSVFLETHTKLQRIIESCDAANISNESHKIAVVGRPNVGKSSLVNMILGDTRIIVSDTPGTTRDLVGDWSSVNGIDFYIMDTAGITVSTDLIEMEGVRRTLNYIPTADIVLAVFDASTPWSAEDDDILEKIKVGKCVIPVFNKSDIALPANKNKPPDNLIAPFLCVSAKTGDGIPALMDLISLKIKESDVLDSDAFFLGERQKSLLNQSVFALDNGLSAVGLVSDDILALDIREAADAIGKITGDSITDDLLNAIFENFCVGK